MKRTLAFAAGIVFLMGICTGLLAQDDDPFGGTGGDDPFSGSVGNVETDEKSDDVQDQPATKIAEPAAGDEKKPAKEEPAERKKGFWACLGRCAYASVMYLPNRLMDATDVFSMEMGVGPEVGMHVMVTRWAYFGGAYGDKYVAAKAFNRQYGGGYSSGWDLGALCWRREERFLDETGSYDCRLREYIVKNDRIPTSSMPSEDVFAERKLDFWAIGAGGGWLFPVKVQVHPADIADLVTGIFFVDLMDDDLEDTAICRIPYEK